MTVYRLGDKVRLTKAQGSLVGFITEAYGGKEPGEAGPDGYFTVTTAGGIKKRVHGGQLEEVLTDPSFRIGDCVKFEGMPCKIAGQSGRKVQLELPDDQNGSREVPLHEVVLQNGGEQAQE